MDIYEPMKIAAAWSIVDRILRRKRDGVHLRAAILRPGGGQYFCLSLLELESWKPVVTLNLAGKATQVVPLNSPSKSPDKTSWHEDGYAAAVVRHGVLPVVDEIEACLGLSVWRGSCSPTTAQTIGTRLIAAIAQREAFGSRTLLADSGFLDGSDGVAEARDWVSRVPAVATAADKIPTDDWKDLSRLTNRLWRVSFAGSEKNVIIDLETGLLHEAGGEVTDLYVLYERSSRALSPVVDHAFALLGQRRRLSGFD